MVVLGLKFKKAAIIIFIGSALISVLALITERAVGIGWDFHPDSLTYATDSIDVANNILEDGIISIFNNLYYVIVAALGMDVYIVTVMNIIIFALTNVKIYQLHEKISSSSSYISILLLLNPYRIHLSTTMLKDSLLIYLFIYSIAAGLRYKYLIPLIAVRIASAIYYLVFLKRKFLYLLGLLGLLAVIFFPSVFDLLESFNAQEMDFRDFNVVPSFQDYGIYGSFVRAFVWPIITITGFYLVLSPSIMFFPLAIGQWMQLYYMRRMGLHLFDVKIISVLFIFALMVTGYTSYLRYILPIMVMSPFINALELRSEKN